MDLVIAIVLQNATVRRSVQILKAHLMRCGIRLRFDERELYGFWQPAASPDPASGSFVR
jgi:hypothetical protein